jgi:hypothetical protein
MVRDECTDGSLDGSVLGLDTRSGDLYGPDRRVLPVHRSFV